MKNTMKKKKTMIKNTDETKTIKEQHFIMYPQLNGGRVVNHSW
jgi:hypothetical protein